jgi:hypothetical protein
MGAICRMRRLCWPAADTGQRAVEEVPPAAA